MGGFIDLVNGNGLADVVSPLNLLPNSTNANGEELTQDQFRSLLRFAWAKSEGLPVEHRLAQHIMAIATNGFEDIDLQIVFSDDSGLTRHEWTGGSTVEVRRGDDELIGTYELSADGTLEIEFTPQYLALQEFNAAQVELMESIIYTVIPGGGSVECLLQTCSTGELIFNVSVNAAEFLVYPIKGLKIIGEGLGVFAPRLDEVVDAAKGLGFGSSRAFSQFGKTLNSGLADAGFGGTKAILQGSAVTGKNFRTGKAFDAASDFDIALAGSSILARAKQLGIGLRSGGTRTGPLTDTQINQLGLGGLRSNLQNSAGREVNFIIFGDAARAPSIGF